jgi:hypothetical protein
MEVMYWQLKQGLKEEGTSPAGPFLDESWLAEDMFLHFHMKVIVISIRVFCQCSMCTPKFCFITCSCIHMWIQSGSDMQHKPPLLIVKQVFFSTLKAALSVDGALLYQV